MLFYRKFTLRQHVFVVNFLFFIFLFVNYECAAQQTNISQTKALELPSPNSVSLGRYGDVPVSHYTGLPNINIPLKGVEFGDLSLDLSLSYHGRGVKVEEESSWTGLSWSLNAGGVITRTIRGQDDFPEFKSTQQNSLPSGAKGYFKESVPDLDHPNVLGRYERYAKGDYEILYTFDGLYPGIRSFQEGIAMGGNDGMPDIFNFNFNGRSGKFIINRPEKSTDQYQIVLLSQEDLKVSLIDNDVSGLKGFKITDEKGVEYWFQKLEKARSRSGIALTGKLQYDESTTYPANCTISPLGSRNIRYNYGNYEVSPLHFNYSLSSWYMTKVVSTTGAVIDLVYNESSEYLKRLPSRVQSLIAGTNGSVSCIDTKFSYSFTISESKNVYLKEIIYGKSKIQFSTSDRSDMQLTNGVAQQKLDRIIYLFAGKVKGGWQFNYSYFDSGSVHPEYIRKRLRLDRVLELDENNIPGSTTSFSYVSHINLPDKDSYAQDLFGYYNGQLSNDQKNVIMPYFPYYVEGSQGVSIFKLGGKGGYSDRDVHEEYLTAGMLKEIIYPLGGRTVFEFESNDYANFESLHYYAGNNHLLPGTNGNILELPDPHVVTDAANDPELRKGMGSRIKTITDYDADQQISLKKTYSYGVSGKLMYAMKHLNYYGMTPSEAWYKLSSHSQNANASAAAGTEFGYGEVQERKTGPNGVNNGWERFKFENEEETNQSLFLWRIRTPCEVSGPDIKYMTDIQTPYIYWCGVAPTIGRRDIFGDNVPNTINSSNGNLLEHEVYDDLYHLIFSKKNSYESSTIKIRGAAPSFMQYYTLIFNEKSVFKKLKKETILSNGVETVTEYSYDPLSLNRQIYTIEKTASDGSVRRKRFKYFSDYPQSASSDPTALGVNTLRTKNIFAPVEIIDEVQRGQNTDVVGGTLYTFFNSTGKIKEIFGLLNQKPIASADFIKSHITTAGIFQKDLRYQEKESVPLYNFYGLPLALKSNTVVNTAYAWGYDGTYMIGRAQNAVNGEFTVMDFDDQGIFLCNHWDNMPVDFKSFNDPDMGNVIDLNSGIGYFDLSNNLIIGKTYEMTFWDNGSDVLTSVSGMNILSSSVLEQKGNWLKRSVDFKATASNLNFITQKGAIKNLIVGPKGSMVKTFTHFPMVGLSSKTNEHGRLEYYDYDALGRLSSILDHKGNLIKSYSYNYAKSQVIFKNDRKTGYFVKSNCASGFVGEGVTYIVEEGKHTSYISKEDANFLAQKDINENGQAYANLNGKCISRPYVALVKENITSHVVDPENAEEQYIEEERGDLVLYFYKDSAKKEFADNIYLKIYYTFTAQPDMEIYPDYASGTIFEENGAVLFTDVPLVRRHYYKDGSGNWIMHPPKYNVIQLAPSADYNIVN